MDVNTRIGLRVRELRDEQSFSLDILAERSGVSRSNISLIERAQSSPTAVVLDKLATALGVSVASLFESSDDILADPLPISRVSEQAVWTDPDSGYIRRTLSPQMRVPIRLVEVSFPAGKRVAYESAPHEAEIHQQLWMIEGKMEITVGDMLWALSTGDCLAMNRNHPLIFCNSTRKRARYIMAIMARPFAPSRKIS